MNQPDNLLKRDLELKCLNVKDLKKSRPAEDVFKMADSSESLLTSDILSSENTPVGISPAVCFSLDRDNIEDDEDDETAKLLLASVSICVK
jgi:hypothetical protein